MVKEDRCHHMEYLLSYFGTELLLYNKRRDNDFYTMSYHTSET
jgi:hypothetical protein